MASGSSEIETVQIGYFGYCNAYSSNRSEGARCDSMDKQTRALVVGGLLLLVNIGIGVTGVVDGIIEGTVADMVSLSLIHI